MNNLTNKADQRVKETFITEGYFHIDLFDGMRLSGPIESGDGRGSRRSRLVETGPSSDWDQGISLDHLIPQSVA